MIEALTSTTLTYTLGGYTHCTGEMVVVANDILVVPHAMPFVIEQAVDLAESLGKWQGATVVRGADVSYDGETRNCSTICMGASGDQKLVPFGVVLHRLSGVFAQVYRNVVNRHMEVTAGSTWELLRYAKGQFFREHVDQVKDHADLMARRLTILCVEGRGEPGESDKSCRGGDLIFPRQGVLVRADGAVSTRDAPNAPWAPLLPPSPGTVVIFPGGPVFPHESTPIEAGVKYTLVSFLK